ncbi:MAG: glycosyltransferase family 2 protein [Planctomycetes bacterium]|nr:glycosyltransferase family 2 protein [Planctomycetota bacterium]
MTPRVSVIVPMFNAAWCVAEAIDSLRAQTLADFEAIVVDDGSADDSDRAAMEAWGDDPRFRLIRQANAGLAGARNTGLDAARGQFVAFLDADDRLMPDALERLIFAAGAGATPGAYGRIEHRGIEMHPTGWAPMTDVPLVNHAALLESCVFPVHAQVIRRNAIGAARFDPALRIGEDWDFWLRVSEGGASWTALDRVVGIYRMTPGSLSRRPLEMLGALGERLRRAHERAGLNPRARDRVIAELTMEWATAAAVDNPAQSDAVAALGPFDGVTPEAAAARAFHRVPWQQGHTPDRWSAAPERWLAPVLGFWSRLEENRRVPEGFAKAALAALGRHASHPALTAVRCLDAALDAESEGVHLLGLGNNARWLAEACERRGARFSGWDERAMASPGWRPAWEGAILSKQVEIVRNRLGAAVIVTPTDDSGFSGIDAVRWHMVHEELASAALRRFRAALDGAGVTAVGRDRERDSLQASGFPSR